jgi:hypothetical protein
LRIDIDIVVGEVIRGKMDRKAAAARIASWAEKSIPEAERERFRDMAEAELLSLHEGNFARYQISQANLPNGKRSGAKAQPNDTSHRAKPSGLAHFLDSA